MRSDGPDGGYRLVMCGSVGPARGRERVGFGSLLLEVELREFFRLLQEQLLLFLRGLLEVVLMRGLRVAGGELLLFCGVIREVVAVLIRRCRGLMLKVQGRLVGRERR